MTHIATDSYLNPKYNDKGRFISYYYQIEYILEDNPESVLEVGIGDKTLVNYLRQHKINIVSCDADENLEPDHVGDILGLPFENDSFDVVCAFQILEHLPWEDVDKALSELARVSKTRVVISLPYTPVGIEVIVRSSLLKRLINTWQVALFVNLGLITRKWKYDGAHFWEMGKRNYPRKKVRTKLKNHFRIVREKKTELSYQYFFVLEKSQSN